MSLLRNEERRRSEERRTVEEVEARRTEAQRSKRRADDIEDATIKNEINDEINDEIRAEQPRGDGQAPSMADDPQRLAPLFGARAAQEFREQWNATQIGFVDDPRRAVQQADELVTEVMKSLAQSFSDERTRLEAHLGGDHQASTENLRIALQRYRSFFERLLSL